MKHTLARAFHYGTWIALISLVVQFFFAGIMIFGVAGTKPHIIMALFIHGLSLVLFLIAVGGKLGRSAIIFAALFFVLLTVQGGLIHLGGVSRIFMALHPVNGVALLFTAYKLTRIQPQIQETPKPIESAANRPIKAMV